MKVNPIPFMIARLKEAPGMTGVRVSSDMVGHTLNAPAVFVTLAPGGKRVVPNRLDAFRITLDYYGPSKKDVSDRAFAVREYLLETLPGKAFGGVAVDEVKEDDLPWDAGDSESKEQRFIHRITVYLYES